MATSETNSILLISRVPPGGNPGNEVFMQISSPLVSPRGEIRMLENGEFPTSGFPPPGGNPELTSAGFHPGEDPAEWDSTGFPPGGNPVQWGKRF